MYSNNPNVHEHEILNVEGVSVTTNKNDFSPTKTYRVYFPEKYSIAVNYIYKVRQFNLDELKITIEQMARGHELALPHTIIEHLDHISVQPFTYEIKAPFVYVEVLIKIILGTFEDINKAHKQIT